MLRLGAYGLLALTVTANALGGASLAERVFLALPAALFGFLVEARTRLALYQHRAAHGDDRLRVRLWLRHPARTFAAWLWLARQSAPAFDRASAERDQLRAARDAVRLALPGRSRPIRRARAGVLRELNAGRLPAATAVIASGLLTRPGVPELHRAALAASLGADLATLAPPPPDTDADTGPDTRRPRPRTPRRTGTAAAVARLRARHPDMTTADIAARLGVSDRTVRRHLATRPDSHRCRCLKEPPVKKVVRYLVIAVLVVWVMTDPTGAAAVVRHGIAAIQAAAHSLSTLATGLSH